MKILQAKLSGNREQRKWWLISFSIVVAGSEEESVTENNLVRKVLQKRHEKMKFER